MTIAHPSPTVSTIKYLYAHAFTCAFDGCRRPLYHIDPESGLRALASRIAHICARSEGGPRWDPAQSAEENRSEANLVIMCTEHAAVIDDPALIDTYAPERLKALKKEQIRKFDDVRQGWILTDPMAAAVSERSFSGAENTFGPGSQIHLGGQGGTAPGAGGGGGGAIGRGSKGGRGGKGGDLRVDDTEYTVPYDGKLDDAWPQQHQDPDLPPRPTPGAGGGGGGVTGDGAVGGDGGNGGNRVVGIYDLEAMQRDGFCGRIEVVIGEGGKPPLPNQLPRGGEDTLIRFLREDGSLIKEVRAEGGLAAAPALSALPDGWIELSQEQVRATRFRVTSLMMVSSAEYHAGNFVILGGDWRYFQAQQIPVDAVFSVLVSFRFDALPDKIPTVAYLSLFDPAGRETARAPLEMNSAVHTGGMANFLRLLGSSLDLAGEWQVRVWSRGQVFAFIDVEVRDLSIMEQDNEV